MNIETANRLYELRKKNGLSQEDVADKLGISRQAVSKWERAEASPDTDNLISLAKLYGVSLDELLNTEKSLEFNLENPIEEKEDKELDQEVLDDDDLDDDNQNKKMQPIKAILDGSMLFICVIAYLIVGFLSPYGWSCYWVLFLLIPMVSSLYDAIKLRRMSRFLYPLLVVFIYCFLGKRFENVEYSIFGNTFVGFWHPLWVLFITIPVYYVIARVVDSVLASKKDK
ncbi:MAG: helix-turn-helix transcriptional regulator [Acholeplasmatales bacterium]|nr:helix-turn-helix transcriptional regulator [Acholeplasmatales bacterium]